MIRRDANAIRITPAYNSIIGAAISRIYKMPEKINRVPRNST
jgi:hypothetical protein